jgi:hypothetical protein
MRRGSAIRGSRLRNPADRSDKQADRPPVAIFGSCVSRDPFSFLGVGEWPIAPYIARQSFVGISDPALEFEPGWFKSLKRFEARCVASDLGKTALGSIRGQRPQILLLDFIDERFDLLKIGETHVSATKHMRQPAFRRSYRAEWKRIPRLSPGTTDAWRRGADRFLKAVLEHLDEGRIVMHEATWAPAMRSKNGERLPFAKPYDDLIPRHNELLEIYFAHIRSAVPRARRIRVSRANLFADPEHLWSKEPFHYTRDYYVDFMNQFRKIAAESKITARVS